MLLKSKHSAGLQLMSQRAIKIAATESAVAIRNHPATGGVTETTTDVTAGGTVTVGGTATVDGTATADGTAVDHGVAGSYSAPPFQI